MSKIKIDKNDQYRVLLTELLPYETPLLFSNEGFYEILKKGKFTKYENKIKQLVKTNSVNNSTFSYGIPYNYRIRKNILGDTRVLSVIHPLNQLNYIDFYKKYDSVILHQTSKSEFSLRRPHKIAKFCYSPQYIFEEDTLKNAEVETEPAIVDKETRVLKSYFTYAPIDLIYKFYERKEYLKLEQRFNFQLIFDINRCFYNIYTHSISWAVKDKKTAKRDSRKHNVFENIFDKLMQQSNYNETNGIVVGPEVSRIFAEIVLQQIDLNVLKELESKKLKIGIDYEIRRYVDDFFVFSNDTDILDEILAIYKKELEEYKLYVNDKKTEVRSTPFITNIAVGKRELKHLIEDLFKTLILQRDDVSEDGEIIKVKYIEKIQKPDSISRRFISDYQCIVKRNELTYDVLSKDIVRQAKSTLIKILKDNVEKDDESFENVSLLLLEIAFYAFSANVTSSTTFKLSQIIVLLCKYLEKIGNNKVKHTIFSKIYKDSEFIMTNFQRKSKEIETNVETLNLLIALKKLGDEYLFSEKKIIELFKLKDLNGNITISKLSYFDIVTLLYYFGNNAIFETLKGCFQREIIKRFEETEDPFIHSELFLLFFDYISCPFVPNEAKKELIEVTKYVSNKNSINNAINEIKSHKTWFMDWGEDIDLERVLKSKEWGSTY